MFVYALIRIDLSRCIFKVPTEGKNSNQQINKSTNQRINKSTNQRINESTNQQMCKFVPI
ncbi:MAG: hypothetical protein EOO50_11605 [Flavobacterium sp.]|nr:MAG: hypothetical protein EOO50_11605 [Flavobacterium sp.]